jgi:predicted molibdopterin-dependent oxidoreductase YjgC
MRIHKALEPAGQAMADWQIISRLSTAMGYPMDYDSPEAIFKV